MSKNLEYRARERQRKRENGLQASEDQQEKGWQGFRARDKKPKETFFCWKNNMKIFVAVTKWEMLAATIAGENERLWKKVNWNTYDNSSIKRVTKKFPEVRVEVVQNNRKEM